MTPNQPFSINGGGVLYKGVEIQGSLALTKAFSLFASGSLNSAKTKGSDKLIGANLWVASAPSHTVALGLLYDGGPL